MRRVPQEHKEQKQNPPIGKVHGRRSQSLLEKDRQLRWTSDTPGSSVHLDAAETAESSR